MPFVTLGLPNHDTIPGVSANDHHVPTVAGDLDLADLNARAHADLSDAPANAHHAAVHIIPSHGDTTATGAELETLTDASDADALHTHPINARIATGTYTGDGALSQAITGIGFQVVEIFISERLTVAGAYGTNAMGYTNTVIVDDNAAGGAIMWRNEVDGFDFRTDSIIALGADGFTVDDENADSHPNTLNSVYNFVARG